MNNTNTLKKNGKKGFTIIETMIAISILAIALTGPLSIIASALKNSYYARDQIVAYYLAQEAIEYVRNQRDNLALQDTPAGADDWLQGVATVTGSDPSDPGSSLINVVGSESIKANLQRGALGYALSRCASTCPPLKYAPSDNTSGYVPYGQDATSLNDSIFTREIIFNKVPSAADADAETEEAYRELVVTVRVTWQMPSGLRTVILRDNLNNWQLEKF